MTTRIALKNRPYSGLLPGIQFFINLLINPVKILITKINRLVYEIFNIFA
jgi:hypothetical protein